MRNCILLLLISVYSFGQQYQKLPEIINTVPHNEYAPSISKDGSILVFQSDVSGIWRLYQTSKIGENLWSLPKPISEINNIIDPSNFVGGAFQTYDGKYLLFTTDQKPGYGDMDIWIAEKFDDKWVNPRNIGNQINTADYEGFPSLSPDGQSIYFMRNAWDFADTTKTKCYYIFSSKKNGNGIWSFPSKLPNHINMYCEECPRILPDGKTLLFSSNRSGGKGGWDIYKSIMNDEGEWQNSENLAFINTPWDDKSPSVSGDYSVFYHAVTYKQLDDIVYTFVPESENVPKTTKVVCKLFEDDSSKPISGAQIDVISTIDTTLIDRMEETSSAGIYECSILKGLDYRLIASAKGYSFISERVLLESPELKIDYELKSIRELPELWPELNLTKDQEKIIEQANKEIQEAFMLLHNNVRVRYEENLKLEEEIKDVIFSQRKDEVIGIIRQNTSHIIEKTYQSYEKSYNANNQYLQILTELIKIYQEKSDELVINSANIYEQKAVDFAEQSKIKWEEAIEYKEILMFLEYAVETKKVQQAAIQNFIIAFEYHLRFKNITAKKIEKDIYLKPLKKDVSIRLSNITFDFDKAVIKKSSYFELSKLIKLLNENPEISVELQAHTDDIGSKEYNLNLSNRRAYAVVKYLTKRGIDYNRIEPKGYGESDPIAPNDTESNRAKNRRVEFKIK